MSVTAGQAEEYTNAIRTISGLSSTLLNKKKHPFLPEQDLPAFKAYVDSLIAKLDAQKTVLLDRLSSDEILEFVESIFSGRTGGPIDEGELQTLIAEGERRYQAEIPPGYKDGKKDGSGDPHRKFGDLIVWRQLIKKAKEAGKPLIFVTDDKKEDWWLEQSGRTIGPRTELREEFIRDVSQDFWMYTVDKFIEEAARIRNDQVSKTVIAEIIEVREEAKAERDASNSRPYPYRSITKDELLERLAYSETWAAENSEGFLGLHSYVKHYLGNAGFDYSASYDVLHQLEDEGLVEVYDHQGEGHERSVKAIRLVKKQPPRNTPLAELKTLLGSSQLGPAGATSNA